ncbi:MAG: UDP-N-acetylmuramate--L-alanine ligase [Eubacteriaceae bacterium]|nr:UDP-N-acetylmuramate--L-alanine ligase [Eubacteriaceae bacterium]
MDKITLKGVKKIYFVGIGGTSMSGLAMMSQLNGFEVSGSDMRACSYTDKLEEKGITVHIGHAAENVPKNADMLVYSAAIHMDNIEIVTAVSYGITLVERSHFLGLLSEFYPDTIAVSGTHGKTTTSSLTAMTLLNAGLDPSISVGGTIKQINANSRVGHSEHFVIEACEFVDSFLHTKHKIGVILNIDEDHLDYFTGGIEQITESFRRFAMILPEDGYLAANGDDENVLKIIPDVIAEVETFGLGEGNYWRAENIKYDDLGRPTYDVTMGGKYYDTFTLRIPGAHNVSNSLSVIAVAHRLGIDNKYLHQTFDEFDGAKRRFELEGEVNGIKVFEDYAHHPKELEVTIAACKNYKHDKLYVVFQPHTYSRTFLLLDRFVNAFALADEVVLNNIYSDRETNEKWNVYSEDIMEKVIERFHIPTRVISEFPDIVNYLTEKAKPGDIVLVAGSQSINQVAADMITALEGKYGK